MDIQVMAGALHQQDADALLLYLFEDVKFDDIPAAHAARAADEVMGGAIRKLLATGDFTGKADQIAVLYPFGAIPAQRVILVGMGEVGKFSVETVRVVAAQGIKKARDLKASTVATFAPGTGIGGLEVEASARAVAEGTLLGLYRFRGQKTDTPPEDLPETLSLVVYEVGEVSAAQQGVDTGAAVARGANLTRDLVNTPPNTCNPSYLAQVAQDMAANIGLRVEVLHESQMRALKMGALLAVAQGSESPPRFIILEHNAERAGELETVVLVGKGITFDTGGYNLKTTASISNMKQDMAGAGAVFGAMRAIAELKVPLHVVGLAPATENMISGRATRPQDVVTASNGKTIEIGNTDAEGRLILADALAYAGRYNPAAVVDMATLTGSIVSALGKVSAGVFCTDDTLRDTLLAASTFTNEKIWPMPLFPEYEKGLKSLVADMNHISENIGDTCFAAAFLRQFTSYPAWAHIDMPGLASNIKDRAYIPEEGGSGYGARLLTEFTLRWARRGQA